MYTNAHLEVKAVSSITNDREDLMLVKVLASTESLAKSITTDDFCEYHDAGMILQSLIELAGIEFVEQKLSEVKGL